MKDDIKLQREILARINSAGYWADRDDLIKGMRIHDVVSNVLKRRWRKRNLPKVEEIRHQLKLLEEKKLIKRTVTTPYIRYEITAKGHQMLLPWYVKFAKTASQRADAVIVSALTSVVVYLLIELIKHWAHIG